MHDDDSEPIEKQVIYLRVESYHAFDEEDLGVKVEELLNEEANKSLPVYDRGAHLVEVAAEEDFIQHVRHSAEEVTRRTGTNPLTGRAA